MTPPISGVVAHLIDPASCHRTTPYPHPLGEGMTGSRTPIRPAPTNLRHHGLEKAPQPNKIPEAAHPAADSMHHAGPASRPFVLAALRALRLGPRSLPGAAHPDAGSPAIQLVDNALTAPRPFRDDKCALISGSQTRCPLLKFNVLLMSIWTRI